MQDPPATKDLALILHPALDALHAPCVSRRLDVGHERKGDETLNELVAAFHPLAEYLGAKA